MSAAQDLVRRTRENPVQVGFATGLLLVIGMFLALALLRIFLQLLWR